MHLPGIIPCRLNTLASITAVTGMLAISPQLLAQQASRTAGIEEVVVTAQKREESLQDTPISMVALGSDALANQGIKSVLDLGDGAIPNVRMESFSGTPGAYVVAIRGISPQDPSQISAESPAGIYIDGIYLGRASGLGVELLDLERVEVLRGPQGTLFGRNALGGAISMVAKKPTGEWGFEQTIGTGNYGQNESITRLNLPKVLGISTKIDYLSNENDGWVKNPQPGEQNWFATQNEGGRIALMWNEVENWTVEYAYENSRSEATNSYWQMTQLSDGAPAFPADSVQQIETSRVTHGRMGTYVGPAVASVEGHSLNVTWDIADNQTLRLISAYRELEQTKQDSWAGSFYRPESLDAAIGVALFGRLSFADMDQDQTSHELQWLGNTDRLEWVAGLYYFEENAIDMTSSGFANIMTADGPILVEPEPSLANPPSRGSEITAQSRALFGQVTWTPDMLDDRLKVTVGGRYTRDKKDGARLYPFQADFKYSENRFDPSLVFAYDMSAGTNAYLKWGTAYRGGGVNTRADRFAPYDADEVETYELGIKSEMWDRKLRINSALFRTVWEGQQIDMNLPTASSPSNTDTINATKDVTYTGFETDVTLAPLPGLTLNLSYAYLDVDYPDQPNPITGQVEEFAPIYAPQQTASFNAEYEFEPLSIGVLSAYVGMKYSDEFAVWASEPEGLTGTQEVWDARITLDEIPLGNADNGNLRVSAWVKNLTDESHETFIIKTLRSFPLIQADLASYNTPRTYGVDFTYSF